MLTSKNPKEGWSSSTSQTFSKNGTMYVILWDGTNYGKSSATCTVSNIDKLPPNKFTPKITEKTTNSMTIDGTTTDAEKTDDYISSGIKEYRFSKDGGKTYTEPQKSAIYKFENLNQTTDYTIVVEVKDNAGNTTTGSIKSTTGTVTGLTTSNAKFTYSPSGWTNGNVTATASTTVSGYTIQTSTDGKTWTSTASVKRSSNGAVYARLWDGTNGGAMLAGNITNIDTAAPVINTALSGTGTTNGINLSMAVSDTQSGVNKIIWYYKLSTATTYTSATDTYTATTANTTRTHKFTGLTQGKTYNAYAVVYDAVGRTKQSSTININTSSIDTASGATYSPSGWTNGNVTITLPTKTGYTTVYTTDGTTPTKSSTKYTSSFTVSSNCKINYVYTDGTNIGGAGTLNITNIDKVAPSTASLSYSGNKRTQYTLNAKGADASSGIKQYDFYVSGKFYKTVTTTSGSASCVVTGRTEGGTYSNYVIVKDKAGNTTQSSSISVTTVKFEYAAYISDNAWLSYVTNGSTAGVALNDGRVMEQFKAKVSGTGISSNLVQINVHASNIGWVGYKNSDGNTMGCKDDVNYNLFPKIYGIEAIQIKLSDYTNFNVQYRLYYISEGWTSWVSNGATAGKTGRSKAASGIQIKLVEK